MKQVPLTTGRLAIYNIRRKHIRSICLCVIVGILAFTLFGGSILTVSLKNGMSSTQKRFGADLMVVPKGYEAQTKGVLLQGEPSYFYFDKSVLQKVEKVKGVKKVSYQFFLTSLSKECCTSAVQLVGFDPASDFTIQPWISHTFKDKLKDGELIIGSEIEPEKNKALKFYNYTYPITARLEKTSTGLDSTVFMNMNTMKQLFSQAKEVGMQFLEEQQPGKSISTVLVKIDKNSDADIVAKSIRASIPNVQVIVPQKMLSNLSSNLDMLVIYIQIFSIALWIITALILLIVFSVTINERKKEFAVFRVLGATRKKLIGILLTESILISIAGSVVGIGLASISIFPFSTYIGDKLKLPYLQPHFGMIGTIMLLSLTLSIIIGPLTSIYSAVKISRAETYITMREGE